MTLRYLKELEKTRLPLEVVEPNTIRKVVILQAALLIDAEICSESTFGPPAAAKIEAITERGRAMIDRLKARDWRSPR